MAERFQVCVFCGSSSGNATAYLDAAKDLAKEMSQKDWGLIYGGGERGIMGTLARSIVALADATAVTGIIPRAMLDDGKGGQTVPQYDVFGQTIVVNSMHERKMHMVKRAKAFVAMPGGFGTIEELFEIITWNQLGIHSFPIVLYNVDGFYDSLLEWLKHATDQGMISASQSRIVVVASDAQQVIARICDYQPASGRYMLNWASL